MIDKARDAKQPIADIASADGGMADLVKQTLLRDKSRPVRIKCSQCSYDLSGTPVGGKCPECNFDATASLLKLVERPAWQNARLASNRILLRLLIAACVALLGLVVIVAMLL